MTLLETLREVNQQVVAGGDYSNYYVAKYDSDFNLIGYYANRNQAVRHHFQKKGLSHKSIILKYLTWNVSLRNAMELGRLWYGNYYMYMAKYKQPLIEVENAPMSWGGGEASRKPIIMVDKNGKEREFESQTACAEYLQLPRMSIGYYKDTGKKTADKNVLLFSKNKKKSFIYFKDAVSYYHMNKNRLRSALKTGSKIRGQKVTILS